MISIINAIKSLFIGNKQVISVSVGDTQVYPNGIVTYQISGTPWLEYSSGQGSITASGSDYARIVGTLVTYVDGVEQSRAPVEFSPTYLSGDSGVWSVSNKHIFASPRGSTPGDARSATFSAKYSENGFIYTYGTNFTVYQQANSIVYGGSAVTMFEIDEYEDGDTITLDAGIHRLTVSAAEGVRRYSWTSGADYPDTTFTMGQTSNFWQSWELVNLDDANWVHFGTGSQAEYLDIDQYTGNTYRTARISFRDSNFPNSTDYMPIIHLMQSVNEWELVASGKTIEGTITGPQIEITSKHTGSVYTDLSVTIVSSNIQNLQYVRCSGSSNGKVTLYFTCSTNTSSSNRTASIKITQNNGGYTRTVTLTQQPYSANFDGIDIKATWDTWVLGEVTEAGTGHKGFIVAKNTSSPLSTGTYNFTASFEYSTATGPNEFEGLTWYLQVKTEGTDVVLTDPRGYTHQLTTSRISINAKYYYGCWMWDNSSTPREMSPDYTPVLVGITDMYDFEAHQGT